MQRYLPLKLLTRKFRTIACAESLRQVLYLVFPERVGLRRRLMIVKVHRSGAGCRRESFSSEKRGRESFLDHVSVTNQRRSRRLMRLTQFYGCRSLVRDSITTQHSLVSSEKHVPRRFGQIQHNQAQQFLALKTAF